MSEPGNTEHLHQQIVAGWKHDTDAKIMTPAVIGRIYANLTEAHIIPPSTADFTFVSLGSHIPTHEKQLWQLDKRTRTGGSNLFIAVDELDLSSQSTGINVVEHGPSQQRYEHRYLRSDFSFMWNWKSENPAIAAPFRSGIDATPEDFQPESVDIFWAFKSVPVFYERIKTEILERDSHLPEYKRGIGQIHRSFENNFVRYIHSRLKPGGSLVVDMAEKKEGEPFDESVPQHQTSGKILQKYANSMYLNTMFTTQVIGEGNARVMVLTKK